NFLDSGAPTGFQDVQINRGGVVHDYSIMLPGEDVPGTAHIRGQLINFVHSIYCITSDVLIPEISDDEFIRWALSEFVVLHVDASYPKAFRFQSFDQVAADEPTSTTYQRFLAYNILHVYLRVGISISISRMTNNVHGTPAMCNIMLPEPFQRRGKISTPRTGASR